MGVSWDEAIHMPWSVTRMMFESRAEAYDAAKSGRGGVETRYATKQDVDNWV